MTQQEFNNLKRGDIVQSVSNSYVIEQTLSDGTHIGVDCIHITNPSEWTLVNPTPTESAQFKQWYLNASTEDGKPVKFPQFDIKQLIPSEDLIKIDLTSGIYWIVFVSTIKFTYE